MSRAATRPSARLGLTLRAILLTPAEGFQAAVRAADRRERAAQRPAEGVFPYVLAAAGGAAFFLLWLKIGALAGLRDASLESYRAEYLTASVVAGGVLGVVAQYVWGAVGARTLGRPRSSARNLRLVWGAAAFPQLFSLLILLPLDLLIVGPEAFTSDQLGDPLATAWAALSIALGVALGVWTAYLFIRGVSVTVSTGRGRTAVAAVSALLVTLVLFAPVIVSSKLTN
jgi:hypothetical protein